MALHSRLFAACGGASFCLPVRVEPLLCSLGRLDASFPSYGTPFLLYLFSTLIFPKEQMALASIRSSEEDKTLFRGNFHADQQ